MKPIEITDEEILSEAVRKYQEDGRRCCAHCESIALREESVGAFKHGWSKARRQAIAEIERLKQDREDWVRACLKSAKEECAKLRIHVENLEEIKEDFKKQAKEFSEELTQTRNDLQNSKQLVKDICSEWNEDCNPTCDSYGHDEDCKSTNIAAAKHAMSQRIAALEAECAGMRDALKDIKSREGEFPYALDIRSVATRALKSNAGADLLERMRKFENLERWVRSYVKPGKSKHTKEHLQVNAECVCPMCKALDALGAK